MPITFYPVRVHIDPSNYPSTEHIPIWNGSIFELKPLVSNILFYSQEPSVLMDTNYGVSSSFVVLDTPNTTPLDNSAINFCAPTASFGTPYDSFIWTSNNANSFLKFTYNINMGATYSRQLYIRVKHDIGTYSYVVMEDSLLPNLPNLDMENNAYGEVYLAVELNSIVYVQVYNNIGTSINIDKYSLTCTGVNHNFKP